MQGGLAEAVLGTDGEPSVEEVVEDLAPVARDGPVEGVTPALVAEVEGCSAQHAIQTN